MRRIIIGAGLLALLACSEEPPNPPPSGAPEAPTPSESPAPRQDAPNSQDPSGTSGAVWESVASDAGTTLRLAAGDESLRMSIACLADPARLVVNVPAFEPVMSEDRFALGLGAEPVTLVANPYEQKPQGGVTGEGPVPGNLAALIDGAAEVRALYGAQQAGPYPAPPPPLKERLVTACSGAGG